MRELAIIGTLISIWTCDAVKEDSIPVIEIRGEGKPMTSAQIRHLEEMANGGPLDIKVDKTWRPDHCAHPAARKDFVTFHYKAYREDGRKVAQTFGDDPIKIQLGVGMTIPGLDKGLKGMCESELRKISVPFRLGRKTKSKVWKNIPSDEHWVKFDVEMVAVEPFSLSGQFKFLDVDGDTFITKDDLLKWYENMKTNYGKVWKNEDIDSVQAANYYVKYFDANGDGKVDFGEFQHVIERDEQIAEKTKSDEKGRKRDPGFAWILDFDNDGIVSYKESDEAAERIEKGPTLLPNTKDEL